MTLRINSLSLIGIALLLLLSVAASAATVSDGTNDVWHWRQSGATWSWQGGIGEKPQIDLVEISSIVKDNTLTLLLRVDGTIQSAETVFYYIFYNTTDTQYSLVWSDGRGVGWAVQQGSYAEGQNIKVTADTISVDFPVLGDLETVDLWGYAVEYTALEDQITQQWWGDWTPNTKFTGGNQTSNGGNDTANGDSAKPSTPGFEALAVIAAVCVAVVLFSRRHR